jgi:serine/threonine protein kinase
LVADSCRKSQALANAHSRSTVAGDIPSAVAASSIVRPAKNRSSTTRHCRESIADNASSAIATLNHPNICTIHDVGPNYLVTELVDGETRREWLMRALPIERNLGIARQVLEALRAAHRSDIVHRDLKPENVMVRSDGYVKVLDFGLAAWMPRPA